jgi:hypothetical protein
VLLFFLFFRYSLIHSFRASTAYVGRPFTIRSSWNYRLASPTFTRHAHCSITFPNKKSPLNSRFPLQSNHFASLNLSCNRLLACLITISFIILFFAICQWGKRPVWGVSATRNKSQFQIIAIAIGNYYTEAILKIPTHFQWFSEIKIFKIRAYLNWIGCVWPTCSYYCVRQIFFSVNSSFFSEGITHDKKIIDTKKEWLLVSRLFIKFKN